MIIPTGLISLYQEAGDALIEFGRRICVVVFPAKKVSCPNCIFNPIGNTSSNRYKSGGPIPFTNGQICPFCHGVGYIDQEVTDTVKLNVYWNPKEWLNILPPPVFAASARAGQGVPFDYPDAVIQTRGYLVDIDKLMKCEYIKIDGEFKFVRASEQIPYGMREARYCVGFWRRL